jgi:hypothetical protein
LPAFCATITVEARSPPAVMPMLTALVQCVGYRLARAQKVTLPIPPTPPAKHVHNRSGRWSVRVKTVNVVWYVTAATHSVTTPAPRHM